VGIVGLGLIGGCLGLDLIARGATVRALVHRQATAERARARALATEVSTDPRVLQECGIVVLALPLDRLLEPDPALLEALPSRAVLTDVGSVKAAVLARWEAEVGGRFVACHPMAGTTRAGVEAGEAGLFLGRPWVATPSQRTDPDALEAVRQLAEAVGGRWLTCSAADHDRAVALISHLPVLVGAALLQSVDRGGAAGSPAAGAPAQSGTEGREGMGALVRALASSGFADTTRVGGGNPELGTLMARCNREALLTALAHYREALTGLEQLVASGSWDALREELERCERLRPEFL
jgi:arogenate dehydrogenase (NADP+)